MEAARQFTANARWAMLAKIISAGVSLPFLLLMPRFLGDIAYGQFALTVSILIVLRLLSGGGLGYATGRRLAEVEAQGRPGGQILTAGISLQVMLALVVMVGFTAVAGPVSRLFGAGQSSGGVVTALFIIAGFTIVFFAVNEFAKAAFQGLQRFHYITVITAIEFTGKLFLAGGLAFAGYGVVVAFSGYALSLAVAATVALALIWRTGLSRPRLLMRDWRELYLYNVPLMLTTAGFIVYTELDTIMIGYFSGFGETGIYAAAKNIVRAAPMFAVPFGQAAAPVIVKLMKDNADKAADFVNRLLKYVAAVFFPAAVAVAVTAPYLVAIWGPTYAGAVVPLRIMSLFLVSVSFGVVITPILDYLGEAPRRARWMMVSVTANIILNLVLIPRFGATGAAVATTVTHGPFVFNNLLFLSRKIGLSGRRLAANMARIVGAAALAGGAATLAMSMMPGLLVGIVAGTATYLALIFMLGVFSTGELSEVAILVRGGSLASPADDGAELVSDGAEG